MDQQTGNSIIVMLAGLWIASIFITFNLSSIANSLSNIVTELKRK